MAKESTNKTWFVNGVVLVYTSSGIAEAEAVGVTDGVINFVGSTQAARELLSAGDEVIDLHGRTVMPGLHDAHLHGRRRGINGVVPSSCDLGYEGGTVDAVLAKLHTALTADAERSLLHSDYVFIATNLFGPAVLPAGTTLTRDDLDRLSLRPEEDEFGTGTTRPVIVIDKGVHSQFTNSIAINNAGVDELEGDDDGHVGRDGNGRATGVFNDFDGVWGPMVRADTDEDYLERIADLAEINSRGITSIFEAAGTLDSAAAWVRAAEAGKLTARVNQSINVTEWARGNTDAQSISTYMAEINRVRAHYNSLDTTTSPGSLVIDSVKVFADGEAEYPHQTAAMLRPYNENVGSNEAPIWQASTRRGDEPSASDALLAFLALDEARWNIHVHCLGDRSTRETLDNFSELSRENPEWDRRHTICHLTFVDPEDISRLAELGIVGNMSLQWARRDAWSVDAYNGYIDEELLAQAYPARQLIDAGVVLSGGSDWPVDPLDPWLQMQTAVTRKQQPNPTKGVYEGAFAPASAITVEEALIMHTLGGAFQMHQEHMTGSIEIGKRADLVIVDENPLSLDPGKLANIEVLATYLDGVLVSGDPH